MRLLADSGSTKADWVLLDDYKIISEFRSDGLNPVYLSEEFILGKLATVKTQCVAALPTGDSIDSVHFFGAGCGNDEGKNRMMNALAKSFPSAKLFVENDLMAAALATCGTEPGIVGILGTGSNCCYYDGAKIHRRNFGLGFILGDEGGGDYFGKFFLKAYMYDELPEELRKLFYEEYNLSFESIIEGVYKKPNAHLFLSSFMPFILAQKANGWVKDFLSEGIDDFFESNVLSYIKQPVKGSETTLATVKVHFVGSVAAGLEDIIREKAKEKNIAVGKITRQPMSGLINYFLRTIDS